MLQLIVDPDLVVHVTKWPHVGASLMFSVEDIDTFVRFLDACMSAVDTSEFPLEFKRYPITKGAQTRRLERIIVTKTSDDPLMLSFSGGVSFTFSLEELATLRSQFHHLAQRLLRLSMKPSSIAKIASFHREERKVNRVMEFHFGEDLRVSLGVREFNYLVLAFYEACSSAHALHVFPLSFSGKKGALRLEKNLESMILEFKDPTTRTTKVLGGSTSEVVDFLTLHAALLHEHSLLISEVANNSDTTMGIVNAELQNAVAEEGHRGARVRRLQQVQKSLLQRLHQKKPTRRKELQQIFLSQGALGVELLSRILEVIWNESH